MVIDLHAHRRIAEPVAAGDCVILRSQLHGSDTVLTDENMLPVLFRVVQREVNNKPRLGILIGKEFFQLASLEYIAYEVIKDYKAHRKDFSPEIAGDNAAESF